MHNYVNIFAVCGKASLTSPNRHRLSSLAPRHPQMALRVARIPVEMSSQIIREYVIVSMSSKYG